MTPEGAALMAEYNRWMNEKVFKAAGTLDEETLAADKGAFFGSILETLNHIAVADTIWLYRFAQHPELQELRASLAEFPAPTTLRQKIAPELAGLWDYRHRLDDLVVRWVGTLTPDRLASQLSYTNMAGTEFSRSFGALLQHFFNHQTHHRGQVSTLLFQSGVDIGVTDLLAIIPSH